MSKYNSEYLAIIPARAGSKRLKNKNKLIIKGKRIIEYTIQETLKSSYLSDIIVSSNDIKILNLNKKYPKVKFVKRKESLSEDKTTTIDVVMDIINNYKKNLPEYILLLQPTSPLRTTYHIDKAIRLLERNKKKYDSLVSVVELDEPHPYKIKKIKNNSLVSFIKGKSSETSRQTLPQAYKLNGAIYLIKTKIFMRKKSFFSKTLPYIMPANQDLNLDTKRDLQLLKLILKKL